MEFSRNNLSPLKKKEGCFVEISIQNGENT